MRFAVNTTSLRGPAVRCERQFKGCRAREAKLNDHLMLWLANHFLGRYFWNMSTCSWTSLQGESEAVRRIFDNLGNIW